MANNKGNWQWQPPKQTPAVTLMFAGNPVPGCPICGAAGLVHKHNKNGHIAVCPGCGAGTAPCTTPFNAARCYVATRNPSNHL